VKLELLKPLWGHEGSVAEAVEQAAGAGFDGIEGPAPEDDGARRRFFAELCAMPWIAEVCTCTPEGAYVPQPGRGAAEHLASLEAGLVRSLEGEPRFVTTMAGWDGWSEAEAMRFFEGVLALEEKHGLAIAVETHRTRWTFSPWNVAVALKRLPSLGWTADFSHWCVVCERLVLDEEPALLETLAGRVRHLHARVGYAQGPQVPDPRAPEHAGDLDAHLRWWRRVWEVSRERGAAGVTMTPEFGPDGYLQRAPFSGEPVADLWELNRWMGRRLREAWAEFEGAGVVG